MHWYSFEWRFTSSRPSYFPCFSAFPFAIVQFQSSSSGTAIDALIQFPSDPQLDHNVISGLVTPGKSCDYYSQPMIHLSLALVVGDDFFDSQHQAFINHRNIAYAGA
jgi:hypothetical protein